MTPAESALMILNVDDNEWSRYALTRLLERNHYRVREAGTGQEALGIAQSELPDLVLLDVNLPDMNGIEVCRRLKAQPETAGIPVMHRTASSLSADDMTRGLEGGADSYLTEPVEPEVLLATIRAVLRARRAEESAHKLVREWRSTFDAISDGVAVVDAHGFIRRCNQGFAVLLGRTVEELAGTSGAAMLEEMGDRNPLVLALKTRTRQSLEIDFDSRRLLITVDPIAGDGNSPSGAVKIVRDVTEHRQLEEQFRESQKFETIGTLAAGVAHDFNNLLTSIMGNASLIAGDTPADSPNREKLDDIVNASQRAADLTKQLLAYSGKARHYMQKVQLGGLVEQVRHLIEAAVPKNVDLEFRLMAPLPLIEADAGQVQQVLMNLVSNAAEAIAEEYGSIVVSVGVEPDGVFLEVTDSGAGMSPEVQARMFDPFFTTKFTGRGLGLAAVAGIARGHKAAIRVSSASGRGTAVRLIFPAIEGQTPQVEKPPPQPDVRTVLVVDDEDMVRRMSRAALEARGYRVLVADNGLDAIGVARRHPEISVVLLDLTMPIMGGAESAAKIAGSCPDARIIVSTGYDQQAAVTRFPPGVVAGYLLKPYTSRELAEKVNAVLMEGQKD